MNEKGLQILEQYEIRVIRSFGGRGAIMLETDQGLKMLKEFAGSQTKLPCEQRLLKSLEEEGVCRTDRIIPNCQGELVSIGEYEIPYVLKNWPPGRECDPRNEEELCKSMKLLAQIHRIARGGILNLEEPEKERFCGIRRQKELEKRSRELKRARSFIRGRHKKGSFELLFLKYAEDILRSGAQALVKLEESAADTLYERARREEHICHGEFVHHNVFPGRPEAAVANFQHFEINVQINDVCLFLRKIMEKHGWNEGLACRMLSAYEKELPLSEEELYYLAVNLSYPEKVWKLIHHYYHANKAWIPEKSAEKLEIFLEQDMRRREMIRAVFQIDL